MYMFASENLGQAFRRFGYFRNLSSQLNQDAERIREEKAKLEDEKAKLDKMKQDAQAVRKERAAEVERLAKEERKADGVVKQLQKDRKKYQNQLAAKKKEVNALNREIERLIAEAVGGGKSATAKTSRTRVPVDVKLNFQRIKVNFHGRQTVRWSDVSENTIILYIRILSFRLTTE